MYLCNCKTNNTDNMIANPNQTNMESLVEYLKGVPFDVTL